MSMVLTASRFSRRMACGCAHQAALDEVMMRSNRLSSFTVDLYSNLLSEYNDM
jgi:hypothetical protein